MASDNVEIVRRAFVANRSGAAEETIDQAIAVADPECEMTSRLNSVEGATYRGHDGIRRYYADLADAFQEWTNELHVIEDLHAKGSSATAPSGV
jgi:hypothetical protein